MRVGRAQVARFLADAAEGLVPGGTTAALSATGPRVTDVAGDGGAAGPREPALSSEVVPTARDALFPRPPTAVGAGWPSSSQGR